MRASTLDRLVRSCPAAWAGAGLVVAFAALTIGVADRAAASPHAAAAAAADGDCAPGSEAVAEVGASIAEAAAAGGAVPPPPDVDEPPPERALLDAFARALSGGGRLTETELYPIALAGMALPAPIQAIGSALLDLVRHDHELDRDEVDRARALLVRLHGSAALPPDLEAALGRAVPPADIRVERYALRFDLCGADDLVEAFARIDAEGPLPAVARLEADPDRLEILSVTADGRAARHSVADGRLTIEAPGARRLEIGYRVRATNERSGHGLVRDRRSGRIWTMTWPYFTGSLFPSNPDPSDGVRSSVEVVACDQRAVVATGRREGNVFTLDRETPPYAIAFYSAPEFEHASVAVPPAHGGHDVALLHGYGIGREVSAETRTLYRTAAAAALAFYSSWLGAYEFGESMSIVELDAGGMGGMEHATAVAVMLDAARDPASAEETAAHEVAHHWFGDNLRIASWPEFWMSEGFTDYATWRYYRHAHGEKAYRKLLRAGRSAVKAQLRAGPHPLRPADGTDVHTFFDAIPYEMGAWMLRMIEVKLGTERFDDVLRSWYRAHRFEPVSTAGFLRHVKRESGVDLESWFARWNAIDELPALDGTVELRGGRARVALAARNEGAKGLTVPLLLTGPEGRTKTVEVVEGTEIEVEVDFEIATTTWDPEMTVLAEVKTPRS